MKKLIVAVALAMFLLAGLSLAQTSKGTIAGTVTDQTGAVVQGAEVTAKDTLGAEVHTVTTGSEGQYRIEAVQPSIYSLSIEAAGFATKKLENIEVKPSIVTPVNTELKPGGSKETVVVEASAQAVQTESAELAKSVSAVDIRELPVSPESSEGVPDSRTSLMTLVDRKGKHPSS